jgi:predicted N-acetyltransferase YhbS
MVRAFVACYQDSLDILGFYYLCLSSYKASIVDDTAAQKFARVDAVPAVYLGMIAAHSDYARQGLGKLLMWDAFQRTLNIAENAGTYALTLDALNEDLVGYYQSQFGFQRFKDGGLEMFLPLATIQLSTQ